MDDFASIFKALSDRTRLRILHLLIDFGSELCICEIMDALKMAQYNVSKHMKELKSAGLVSERKIGKFVFYTCSKPALKKHRHLFKEVESLDYKVFKEDDKRLAGRLRMRVGGCCVVGVKRKGV
jgi:ArsR family transcriptional regulator